MERNKDTFSEDSKLLLQQSVSNPLLSRIFGNNNIFELINNNNNNDGAETNDVNRNSNYATTNVPVNSISAVDYFSNKENESEAELLLTKNKKDLQQFLLLSLDLPASQTDAGAG